MISTSSRYTSHPVITFYSHPIGPFILFSNSLTAMPSAASGSALKGCFSSLVYLNVRYEYITHPINGSSCQRHPINTPISPSHISPDLPSATTPSLPGPLLQTSQASPNSRPCLCRTIHSRVRYQVTLLP